MFGIVDSGGNILAWYDDEVGARGALDRMVEAEPAAAEYLAVIQFDEHGYPDGDAILPPRVKVTIEHSQWLRSGEVVIDEPSAAQAGALDKNRNQELVDA